MVDGSERETITHGATEYELSCSDRVPGLITDGANLSLAFPESAEEFETSEAWDEGKIVANLEWGDGPQLRIVARSDRFIVTYRAMLSGKGSVHECGTSARSDCAIGPVTVLDRFAVSWTSVAAEQLVTEITPD